MTQLHIQIALHFAATSGPYPADTLGLTDRAIGVLLEAGVIQRMDPPLQGIYCVTALGRAWIALLCATPLPRVAYLDAKGREVKL